MVRPENLEIGGESGEEIPGTVLERESSPKDFPTRLLSAQLGQQRKQEGGPKFKYDEP